MDSVGIHGEHQTFHRRIIIIAVLFFQNKLLLIFRVQIEETVEAISLAVPTDARTVLAVGEPGALDAGEDMVGTTDRETNDGNQRRNAVD